jgi:peptide/nickel transport system permease protein
VIRFVMRRLLLIAVVAVAIVFFVHFGMEMARLSESARPNYTLSRMSTLAWNLSRSFLEDALHGEFGTVTERRATMSVRDILENTYGKSMGLLLASLAVAGLIGLIAGAIAALARRSWTVLPLLTVTILGISTPTFFAALLLQILSIRIVDVFHMRIAYIGGFGWDRHMVLPTLVLAARPVAYITRAVYNSLSQTLGEDYVRTARAKGLNLRQVLSWHVMRNVAVPILTAMGVSLRFALGSLPIVEYFFAWPGLGARLLEAIQAGQTNVVATLALALGLTFLTVNLCLDIIYRLVDPRLGEIQS